MTGFPTIVIVTACAAGAVCWVRITLRVITVRGHSMAPTYHDGDRLLVRRWPRRVHGDDVVVFRPPARASGAAPRDVSWLVKRVVAVPGDAVPAEMAAVVTDRAVTDDHFLVRGDNPRSLDSRHFGYVPRRAVTGTVIRVLRRSADVSTLAR